MKVQFKQPPKELIAFRGQNQLTLDLLPDDAEWDDVKKSVKLVEPELTNGFGLEVLGKVNFCNIAQIRESKVKLIVVSKEKEIRDGLVDALRIRISPWKLLYTSLKNEVLGSELSQNVFRSLFTSTQTNPIPTEESKTTKTPNRFADNLKKIGVAPDLVDKVFRLHTNCADVRENLCFDK